MRTGEKERRELKVTSYLGNTALNPMTISLGEYIYASLSWCSNIILLVCVRYITYTALVNVSRYSICAAR